MKKIIIKEIDRFKSIKHKYKYVSEYLIYLDCDEAGLHINAYTEIGDTAKRDRVNELLLIHFVKEDNTKLNIEDIVEEMSLFKN